MLRQKKLLSTQILRRFVGFYSLNLLNIDGLKYLEIKFWTDFFLPNPLPCHKL